MQMLRTLPHFGLVSLFIIWFGIGETPKVALIAMGATFPLYLNTFSGIRSIDRKTLEAAKSMHLTWPQRVRHVVIPGALPQTLVGPAPEPRHRLALADRRGDHQRLGRPGLRDPPRQGLPADRRDRRRPRRLQPARPDHRRDRPLPRKKGPGMARLNHHPTTAPTTPSGRVRRPGDRATTGRSVTCTCSARSTSTSSPASSSSCSGAAAAASPRCCAAWRTSTRRRRARSRSTGRTSVAFQEPRLLPWRRVRENVELALLNTPERRYRGELAEADADRGRPRPTSSTSGRCSCPAARRSGSRWPGRW